MSWIPRIFFFVPRDSELSFFFRKRHPSIQFVLSAAIQAALDPPQEFAHRDKGAKKSAIELVLLHSA